MKFAIGVVGALLVAGCAASTDDSTSTADLATSPAHVDPGHHGRPQLAASTTAQYYGGGVIPNAKVYVVYWGDGSNLLSQITKPTGGIADFYAGILDSPYMDGLTEYSTNRVATAGSHKGQQGTNQIVGRGSYAGTIALTSIPSGNNIDDSQVQSTIESAITAGKLPQPDENTLFQIYFPPSVTISIDGMGSCSAFGGYHEQTANMKVAYSVIPQCYNFSGIVSVSSHELVEAITDVLPTPGSSPDYPQAWNDSGGNEMGDLCETSSSNYTTAKGSFYVQTIWYESVHGCKITHTSTNDFTVQGAGPTTLAAGASTTVSYKLAAVGNAQSLALSVTAPAGVTATLSSATANTGDTVTVTLTADAGASVPDGQVILQATGTGDAGATRIHSAATLVKVTH
jgi:hypothetical protein